MSPKFAPNFAPAYTRPQMFPADLILRQVRAGAMRATACGGGPGREEKGVQNRLSPGNSTFSTPPSVEGIIFLQKNNPLSEGSKKLPGSRVPAKGSQNGSILSGKTNDFGVWRRPEIWRIFFFAKKSILSVEDPKTLIPAPPPTARPQNSRP